VIIAVGAQAGDARTEVREADDCRRFHVESALDPSELDGVLRAGSAGHADDHGAAWIRVDWVVSAVRASAQATTGADWHERFEAMLGYARGKGWLDAAGTHIRAHVVASPSAGAGDRQHRPADGTG
jgi:hypothetical protein